MAADRVVSRCISSQRRQAGAVDGWPCVIPLAALTLVARPAPRSDAVSGEAIFHPITGTAGAVAVALPANYVARRLALTRVAVGHSSERPASGRLAAVAPDLPLIGPAARGVIGLFGAR